MFKLYLGCAIHFGERKPYVDLSDPPQYTCVHGTANYNGSVAKCASYIEFLYSLFISTCTCRCMLLLPLFASIEATCWL